MQQSLRDEFTAEIEELIESCIKSLLKLEKSEIYPQSPLVQECMRCLHTA